MLIHDKIYNWIKWSVVYLLPALNALFFSMSQLWGIPYSEQIFGTITSVTIFLSVVMGLSSSSYKKNGLGTDGVMVINTTNPDKDVYCLQLNNDVINLAGKDVITFKVDRSTKK